MYIVFIYNTKLLSVDNTVMVTRVAALRLTITDVLQSFSSLKQTLTQVSIVSIYSSTIDLFSQQMTSPLAAMPMLSPPDSWSLSFSSPSSEPQARYLSNSFPHFLATSSLQPIRGEYYEEINQSEDSIMRVSYQSTVLLGINQ